MVRSMQGRAKRKAGKLVILDLTYEDTITQAKMTGDFFIHPEERINDIETTLTGTSVPVDVATLQTKLAEALQGAECVGLTSQDIAELAAEATR